MSTETTTPAEDEFSRRMKCTADLDRIIREHVWNDCYRLRLGGEDFEVAGCDEVPGYEDEDWSVFLRRKSDGKVFEADIDITVHPVQSAEMRAEEKERYAEMGRRLQARQEATS